jgi:hypothetical protein
MIACMGVVAKIGEEVVRWIPVIVSDLKAIRRRAIEREHHRAMNIAQSANDRVTVRVEHLF